MLKLETWQHDDFLTHKFVKQLNRLAINEPSVTRRRFLPIRLNASRRMDGFKCIDADVADAVLYAVQRHVDGISVHNVNHHSLNTLNWGI